MKLYVNMDMWFHQATENWYRISGLEYPAVLIFVLFFFFAFGACIGSFLNVCIWRIPRGESLSKAASHCTTCGASIRWYDNIPVASYLILRGKCRACHSHYSSGYFWVELICGILTALVLLKTGLCQQSAGVIPARMMMVFFGAACALTDIRSRIVPDKLTYTGMIFALIAAACCPDAWGTASCYQAVLYSLASGLVPGCLLLIFAELGKLIARRDVIGMGDIKFITMSGLLLGFPGAVFTLLAGSLFGSLWGLAVKRKFTAHLPFVPFMTLAAFIWIFFDCQILGYYLNLFVKL